jgi:hypothetical protein
MSVWYFTTKYYTNFHFGRYYDTTASLNICEAFALIKLIIKNIKYTYISYISYVLIFMILLLINIKYYWYVYDFVNVRFL